MQTRSYGSVKVAYLDRKAVLAAVHRGVRNLARRRSEVLRVLLFGSMARGDAVPGSDVDLLVVLTRHDKGFMERIPEYRLKGIPIGVDVFPYTEQELAKMLRDGNLFLRAALKEGIEIFHRRAE